MTGAVTTTVAPRIRSFFLTVTMRCVVVIITNAAAPPQTIQDNASRTDTCFCEQRNCPSDGLARCFCRSNHNAQRLNVWRHQKGVANGENRSAVDYNAIEERASLGAQTERRAGGGLAWR